MEKPESSMGGASVVELEDRDPNNLNQHLQVSEKNLKCTWNILFLGFIYFTYHFEQVMWDDVIGEPEGIKSPECAWRLSGHCFRLSRGCCYVFLSVLVAPLAALCLGFSFACLAFQHIWCIAPCLRVWKISCAATRNFVTAVVQAVVQPCTTALGFLFYNVRLMSQKLPDGPDRKEDFLII